MTQLTWNDNGTKIFELGCDRGVFYPPNAPGVPWNGLLGVSQSSSGGGAKPYYMDGIKYLNRPSGEDFLATLEALTYPDEFAEFDGSPETDGLTFGQQNRKSFDFSYRTLIANDLLGQDYGYKIHLVYNALAAPAARANKTLGDAAEPMTLSWELSTTPVKVPGRRPTAYFSINSTKLTSGMLQIVESILYGTSIEAARMPTPTEWVSLLGSNVFELRPNTFSGLWPMTLEGLPDLVSTSEAGLFSIPPTTRLSKLEAGLYKLNATAPGSRIFKPLFEGSF